MIDKVKPAKRERKKVEVRHGGAKDGEEVEAPKQEKKIGSSVK